MGDRSVPDDIRAAGWYVAVHNDYFSKEGRATFWLFTHPPTGRFIKGEGPTDAEALDQVRGQLERQNDLLFKALVKLLRDIEHGKLHVSHHGPEAEAASFMARLEASDV